MTSVNANMRAPLCPETTGRSVLHRLAANSRSGATTPRLVRIYLAAAASAYVPVLIAAALQGLPLWDTSVTSVPFLRDWGLAFALLVSFPTLLVLFIDDQRALREALTQVHDDGVIEPKADTNREQFTTDWQRAFATANLWSYLIGGVGGIGLAMLTVRLFCTAREPSWLLPQRMVEPVTVEYAYGISLLYAMVIVYIWRSVTISRFLRAYVAQTNLRLLPLHPDQCGGLRPVGQIGLRNQYVLTTLGINIVLLVLVWVWRQASDETLRPLIILASVAYLVCGPLVFMGPLLPFRDVMLRAKRQWSSEIAALLRAEFSRLRDAIRAGNIEDTDEKVLERLRKFGALIDELPVWPFDPRTLRAFAAAFVVPLALPVLGKVISAALGL